MEKSPSHRTPLMEMFLDAQREKLQEQLKSARKYSYGREEQARAIALLRMIEASLDLALVVSGAGHPSNVQAEQIIVPVPTWIEPAKPIQFNGAPFLVAALNLMCSGDPDAIRAAQHDAPPAVQEALESLHQFVDRWMVDVIDAAGEIVFGMVYEQGYGWRSSQESELCPWRQCHEQQATFVECARCKSLRERITNYVCAVLAREGIEHAGIAKALGGLKVGSTSSLTKPDNGDQTEQHPQNQETQDLLIERYRANRANDVQRSVRLYELQGNAVMAEQARTLQSLHSTLLDMTTKVYIDAQAIEKILSFMKLIAHGERSVPPDTYNDPTRTLNRPFWIECEKPITITGVPLVIQGLLFARPSDPLVKKAFLSQGYNPHLLEQKALQFWGVDLVSDQGMVNFNFVWTGRSWSINSSHDCPFGQCTTTEIVRGRACQTCQTCYKWAAMWLGTVLLARTGHFQEIRREERALHSERMTPTNGPQRHIIELNYEVLTSTIVHEEPTPAPIALRRLQASGLPAFLDAYRRQESRRIEEMKRGSGSPFEIRATQLLTVFQVEVLKSSKILLIPDHAQRMIEQKIKEYGGVDGPRIPTLLPSISSRSLWIKLANPLSIAGALWKADALFLSQSNDPKVIEKIMPLLDDPRMREMAQRLRNEPKEFALDVIDTDKRVQFTLAYKPGERFLPSSDSHQCHYHAPGCGQQGQICPACRKVLELISGYFSMILLARSGEFAEFLIIEETERVKREEPDLPADPSRSQKKRKTKKKHRQATTWEDRTISTLTVKVSQKVVVEECDADEKRQGHPHWMKLHKQEDIESYQAVQPSYLRNGKRITPKVARQWYKLKKTTSVEEMQ
jgi:hypothetical protein